MRNTTDYIMRAGAISTVYAVQKGIKGETWKRVKLELELVSVSFQPILAILMVIRVWVFVL